MEDTRDRLQSQELKRVEPFQWEEIEGEDEIQAILNFTHCKGLENNVLTEINSMNSLDNRRIAESPLSRNIHAISNKTEGLLIDRKDGIRDSKFNNINSSGNKNTTNLMVPKNPLDELIPSVHKITTIRASASPVLAKTHTLSQQLISQRIKPLNT